MILLVAHIAGIPVEEMLLYSAPVLTTAVLACRVKIGDLARVCGFAPRCGPGHKR